MKFRGKVAWWFYAIMIGVAALLIPLIVVSAFVEPNRAALIMNLILFVSIECFSISIPIDHSFLKYKKELTEYGWQVGKISMKEQTVMFSKMD